MCQSTPESSQTESEDVSPQVQRRRRLHGHSRDILPRFSISGEEDWLRLDAYHNYLMFFEELGIVFYKTILIALPEYDNTQ